MRALLHASCPVKVYTFHIRIKFLTDLLPCGGKHQNSTMPGGKNRELRFQTVFSATNAQLKYSWVYEREIVLLGYGTCLWSFLNEHFPSPCNLGKITAFRSCFKLFLNIPFTKGNAMVSLLHLLKNCIMEGFACWYLCSDCMDVLPLNEKQVFWDKCGHLWLSLSSPGRHKCHFPFPSCLFVLRCVFLQCVDWSFCAFAEPPSPSGLELTRNCSCNALRWEHESVWNPHDQLWGIQREHWHPRHSTWQVQTRGCINILWHCAALKESQPAVSLASAQRNMCSPEFIRVAPQKGATSPRAFQKWFHLAGRSFCKKRR